MTGGPLLLPPPDAGVEPYAAYGTAALYGEEVPCLVLRFRDGRRVAASYYWLRTAEYRPGEGVRLAFADGEYLLRGRNLLGLFEAVSERRARWVWEADRAAEFQCDEADPVVTGVEFAPAAG